MRRAIFYSYTKTFSHTFSGVFNVPHGIANATLLPFVMRFNLPACPDKMVDIANALGEKTDGIPVKEAVELAIQAIIKLNNTLNIPSNIKDLHVSLDVLPKLVEDSMRSGNVLINPRLTSSKDIKEIIENAYNGPLIFNVQTVIYDWRKRRTLYCLVRFCIPQIFG
ncbi:iron-containing alcohol dehydrogenase [Fictibacillus enclensis]|uniref:iron-containing alcohol dehydrogenase n=1 Tax=Fictibacillus enclensis TaxID=1017270 RepID=UPI0025A2C419|nr:iron-containing alcohol dehydrogenase [Fictibacillus enclensis]MDM5198241.1 iron-containing alcohol dehydrogenase [Fictibacillus enclensis]